MDIYDHNDVHHDAANHAADPMSMDVDSNLVGQMGKQRASSAPPLEDAGPAVQMRGRKRTRSERDSESVTNDNPKDAGAKTTKHSSERKKKEAEWRKLKKEFITYLSRYPDVKWYDG